MSDSNRKEIDAFLNFFTAFDLTCFVAGVRAILDDLLHTSCCTKMSLCSDSDYFRPTTRMTAQNADNWVLWFSSLKRLYRLMTQYFSDVIQKPTNGLDVPDLQAMAKNADETATLVMCRLTIAIGVQCEKNKVFIDKIQGLSQTDQHHLMRVIEQVRIQIRTYAQTELVPDNVARIHKSAILNQKETLEKVYQQLLEEHRQLQTTHDDVLSERGDLVAQLKEARREVDNRRNDGKADVMLRAEIDRLRTDLQKSEDNLAIAESELDKQTATVTDLNKKVEDLQSKADEASLEKQNADLVDVNASIEEEFRKVAAFKPLMESYKNQILDLENKSATRTQELENLKFELEQTQTKLKVVSEERAKDSETIELYQERVKELELASDTRPPKIPRTRQDSVESADASGQPLAPPAEDVDDEEDAQAMGLGGELHDAESGTTMTDLKLQIRKLKRELEAVRKNEADASRVLVLENLLEDANRMKSRYETDYLAAHREKLVLQRDLEEIRSGKSMGDGAEAAIALRQRLNESVEQLDAIRKEHAELEVKFEAQSKELTIAKSDLTLVNKDQLDILASLRDSVNEDKAGLEADVERLQKQNKELAEKNRMQLEQVNVLLLEKVNLQSEGIGQRERMLQRERDFGDLRASLSGKDLPEDIKQRLLALHEDNVLLKESLKTSNEKLSKAKTFIKNQDKLYREEQAGKGLANASGMFEDTEAGVRPQIKILEDELERQKVLLAGTKKRYMQEAKSLMSYIHSMGMNTMRGQLGQRPGKTAWLTSQRSNSRLQRTV
ncbi:HOOK-domain-containing protein [Lentinula raphanica]|nr:HOOK-domain-containing protein [Lentinula raphanica]